MHYDPPPERDPFPSHQTALAAVCLLVLMILGGMATGCTAAADTTQLSDSGA